MRRFGWLSLMMISAALVLTACGDDGGGGDEDATDDAMIDMMEDTEPDTEPDMEEDMGMDQEMTDPCEGVSDCDTEGTSCDGDTVVTCAPDADGCLVESTEDCAANGETCDDSEDPAVCVDPCEGVSTCDTEGRSCDGASLVVCEADANGCLIESTMDCAANSGTNFCDDTGAMAICANDPCLAEDGTVPADACDTAGTSCMGDSLVSCEANAFGCLKESTTDCTTATAGACDDSGAEAICTTTDACMDECSTAGETSCNGNTLVTCQADAFGCLVEVPTDCTSVPMGYCDATATAMCAIDDAMRCAGKDLCMGDMESATCNMDTLTTCEFDMVGCLVETVTDCTTNGEVCNTDMDGNGSCGPACTDAPECSGGASEACIGNSVAICADTNMDGCLEYTEMDCMADICDDSTSPVKCVAQGSGDSCMDPYIVLNSGTTNLTGTDITADFTDTITMDGTDCSSQSSSGTTFPDIVVEVRLTAGDTVVVTENGGLDAIISIISTGTCASSETCDSSIDFGETTGVSYTAAADETVYAVVEPWSGSPSSVDYDVGIEVISCGDGVVGTGEACDDGNNMTGDGCSDVCEPEFGYACDNSSGTSVCTPYPSIGTFAAGDTIPDTTGGPVTQGESDLYTITFTTDVVLSGTLDGWTTGDGDVYFVNSNGELPAGGATVGTESFSDQGLAAGTYVVDINAFSGGGADLDAYTLALTTTVSSCGDGIIADGSEACDDNNMMAGDGCDAMCAIEMGYICEGQPSSCFVGVSGSSTPNLAIPDDSWPANAVTDTIVTTGTCTIDTIEVDVDVSHGWKSDVVMELTSPTGTVVVLEDGTRGGSNDDIVETYPTTLMPIGDLSTLTGETAIGTWTMTIGDDEAIITGTLNSWGISVVCQ